MSGFIDSKTVQLCKYNSRELDADRYTCIYEYSCCKTMFETGREVCFCVRSLLPYSITLTNANKHFDTKGIGVKLTTA